MKLISIKHIINLVLGLSLLGPSASLSDQTDSRLNALFSTLKTSENSQVLQQTEKSIWAIWFASGQQEIDSLMEKAGIAVQLSQLAQAEKLYSQVVEKAPDFSEGWNRRATIRYYQSDYSGSLEDIRQTLALEPRHFGAIWGLGMILGWERDFSGAITAFEHLLEIKPNARDARKRIEILKQELAKNSV